MHKKGHDFYINLGGKKEPGETALECLKREVREEIGCEVKKAKEFGVFEGKTVEDASIRLECFLHEIEGKITLNPADSIDGFLWIDRNYKQQGIRLAQTMDEQIVPALVKQELL